MNIAVIRRSGPTLVSAVALASLLAATTAAPVAAKPTCQYRRATIVGTANGEVIRGTPRRDVIVAGGGNDTVYGLGGNDLICGGPGDDVLYGGTGRDRIRGGPGRDRVVGGDGHDWLFGDAGMDRVYGARGSERVIGGPGPDRLYGGSGVDLLAGFDGDDRLYGGASQDILYGGPGNDRCVQGPATGPHLGCEIVAPVPPADLAIAWSDLDGDHRYGPGDVLISRLFDTNGDGIPSAGDTVFMGQYPVDFRMTAFADWGVDSHEVVGVTGYEPEPIPWPALDYDLHRIAVRTVNGDLWWTDLYDGDYGEQTPYPDSRVASFQDGYREADERCASLPPGRSCDAFTEFMYVRPGSPSLPDIAVDVEAKALAVDEGFIDTEVYP